MQSNEKNGRDFYALAWRWHFYAGLFVAPFMILLALTGIVYLFKPQLDALLYPQLLRVEAGAQMRSADQLLAGVRQAYPQATVSQYLPPSEAGRSAQFVIGEEGRQWNLFVDPYSGRELGRQDAQLNLQAVARALHGELMVGTVGDRLIELAAGWGIVLVVSGLYLWWPRGRAAASALFWPRLHLRGRPLWRDLHVVAGFWGSLLLLFMLLSGMTWTGYWGKQFADVWNRFPAAMWNDVPTSDMQAGSLNSASRQQVPWPLENTPLPRSQPPAADAHAEHRGHSAQAGHAMPMDMPMPAGIPLQRVVDIARERGVAAGYGIALPSGMEGLHDFRVPRRSAPRRHPAHRPVQRQGSRRRALAGLQRGGEERADGRRVARRQALRPGQPVADARGLPGDPAQLGERPVDLVEAQAGRTPWRAAAAPRAAALEDRHRHHAGAGRGLPLVGASLLLVWALDWLVLSRLPAVRRVLA